jgi:hypothetical protein
MAPKNKNKIIKIAIAPVPVDPRINDHIKMNERKEEKTGSTSKKII